nr:elongation of very long chain fatty acids protein 7-like [Parasteatoda tepidariorum]
MATGVIYEFLFDHNVFDHILISHSIYPLSIAVSYVLFTKYLGPSLMRNKNGLQLKNFMIGFNLFLCLLNTYLSWTGTSQLVRFFYMNCRLKESPDYNIFKEALQLYGWHIYLVKFFELFDTVIFVLRKKFSQITFLHVFHHSIVFLICWISMRIQVVGIVFLLLLF